MAEKKLIFNNSKEIEKYLNKNNNTFEFLKAGKPIEVEIKFDLKTDKDIAGGNITFAGDIKAGNIKALNIDAKNMEAYNIDALNINAFNIDACDIRAFNINAFNIDAYNIIASWTIKAEVIRFKSVCCAYNCITCKSINSWDTYSKYFSLKGDVFVNGQKLKKVL